MSDSPSRFEVDADGSFYITIAEAITIYEHYDAAVVEIQEKLATDSDAFVAEMSVDGDGEDVTVNLEQVDWPTIIRDMADR